MNFRFFTSLDISISRNQVLALFGIVFILQGCATTSETTFNSVFEGQASKNDLNQEQNLDEQDGASQTSDQSITNLSPLNVDTVSDPESSAEVLELSDTADILVSFDKVELEQFVNHSLANLLKVNFFIDPQTQLKDKKITLALQEKVSQKRYLELFKELIEQNELAMKIQNDVVFIFGNRQRRGLPEYDYGFGRDKSEVPVGSQPIFQVIPINFIDSTSLANFILKLSNASPEILADPNLLGIRGKRHDVLRAIDLISILDVPSVRGRMIRFIRLDYIPSFQFIEKVTELLTNEGVNVKTVLRFTDLSRQNGVVIHSNNDDIINRVEYWKQQLDTPESTDDRQYFTYYPENMEASKLAEVLDKLTQVMNASGSAGSESTSVGLNNQGSQLNQSINSAQSQGSLVGTTNDFSYVTDENRNVIIIYSNATKFKSILPLLKKLDVAPPQVLIEARLIEVTLTDQISQGVEWSLLGGANKNNLPVAQRSSFDGGVFSYTISGVDYNLALNLLKNQDRLKVLSSPRIVVANGETATINVGTEIPVLATQSADVDSDRVLQSIQYRSTGVDLTVKPVVNSSNVVSLEIAQNVSETSENASSGIDSPIILNRSFKTSVIANSGQSLVLGGLIRENNSSDNSGIPILGELPLIGRLFSNDSRSTSRTELIVLITPRVISNSSDIDEIRNLFVDEFMLFDDLP